MLTKKRRWTILWHCPFKTDATIKRTFVKQKQSQEVYSFDRCIPFYSLFLMYINFSFNFTSTSSLHFYLFVFTTSPPPPTATTTTTSSANVVLPTSNFSPHSLSPFLFWQFSSIYAECRICTKKFAYI